MKTFLTVTLLAASSISAIHVIPAQNAPGAAAKPHVIVAVLGSPGARPVPYEIFCGAGETIGALLLFFRRTTTLGALVGGAVLTNVFAINMAYDIPVKQYSFHLLALCAFLAACDADRLLNLFVRNRAVAPRFDLSLFATPMARRIATAVGTVLVLTLVVSDLWSEYQGLHQYGRLAPRSPLYGIYEFEQVEKNGVAQPPLLGS